MRKNHKRPIPYPNAAEPEYFVRKFIEFLQCAATCIGITLTLCLMLVL